MRKEWLIIIAAALVAGATVIPQSGLADYMTNAYMAAVLRLTDAYPDTFLESGQRFGTESIDSTTIIIPLDDGTRTIFLTSNAMVSIVYGYSAGVAVDTLRIKPGTSYTLYVSGRDSLRVERAKPTMFTWVKNPSYEGVAGGYMNQFSKACPYAHGDTLGSGQTTMSYSTRAANLEASHPGYCNNFQCCIVTSVAAVAASKSRLLIQAYYNGHKVAQLEIPHGLTFQTEAWTFDSLKVTTLGTMDAASYSVSWNHGTY